MIGEQRFHRRRHAQGPMHSAEVVVSKVYRAVIRDASYHLLGDSRDLRRAESIARDGSMRTPKPLALRPGARTRGRVS